MRGYFFIQFPSQ